MKKNIKFKLRSIWKSKELEIIAMVFFILIPTVLMFTCPEENVSRNTLTTARLISLISTIIVLFIGAKIVLRNFYNDIND